MALRNAMAAGRPFSESVPACVQFVVFELDGQHYGLPLGDVERVVRIVEITLLPKAPEIVLGVVNVQGSVVPVINVRRRFGLPERDIELTDQLVVARTPRRRLALVADATSGVAECEAQDIASSGSVVPGLEYVEGIAKTRDGLILIHDLARFLALEEAASLERVMDNV